MDERTLIRNLRERNLSMQHQDFHEAMKTLEFVIDHTISANDGVKRFTLRRIKKWLTDQCLTGCWDHREIFPRVAYYALEASGPDVHSPYGLLVHILKEELGYDGKGGTVQRTHKIACSRK